MKMKKKPLLFVLLALIMAAAGCQTQPDFEALKVEILDLHQSFIKAHLNKNIDILVRDLSEDYFSVSRGEINKPSKEEMRSDFSSYLNNTSFSEYRDLQDPVIGISKDGSMAWSIFKVKVAGKRTMENGSERDLDFICAWIFLYERRKNKWIVLGDVSTFK